MGLVFRATLKPLSGYTDLDWAGDLYTRQSTSRYVFSLGSPAIGCHKACDVSLDTMTGMRTHDLTKSLT
jgi:hypothetical protein